MNVAIETPKIDDFRNIEIKIDRVIVEIKTSDFIKDLWLSYSKQHTYANKIKFEQVIEAIERINYKFNN